MKLKILGRDYKVVVVPEDDHNLDGADGRCSFWSGMIWVSDCSAWGEETREAYYRQILRHEIIHAFLFESGMAYNSASAEHWAMNEEMVDWFAIQGPKVLKIWEQAGCL